jgi:putative lipoic acid-binding regulatory protein
MALNRNIMVTVGGDLNNRVATYENSFTPDQAHPHIHIIWRRAGGGHYESIKFQIF